MEISDDDKLKVFTTIAVVNCEEGNITEKEARIACRLFSFYLQKIKEPNAVSTAIWLTGEKGFKH